MKTILPILRKTLSINTLIVVLSLVIYSIGVNATVRYVKPIATGMANGSSWDNAHPDIQMMINASEAGDSVWVAAGEYKPNDFPTNCQYCTDSRFFSFYIKDGVQLFGNFNGTETNINQRDFGTNTTFLSGDLYGNDDITGSFNELAITGNEENVYHVILVCGIILSNIPITIDGFTIKGGNANDSYYYNVNSISITQGDGGGIFVRNFTTVISNCFIANNSAKFGAGIYTNAPTTYISNNIIASNIAIKRGGGIITISQSNLISNNSFIGNYALTGGGGIYCVYSDNTIINNEINGNTTDNHGGGVYFLDATITTFNNTITNNYATNYGGGFYSYSGTSVILDNIISHNTAGINGGGLYLDNGIYEVINNVIYRNTADMFGGGIYSQSNTNAITNNTIVGNVTNNTGGGIYFSNVVNTFRNNILWDNKLIMQTNVSGADLFLNICTNTFQNNIFQLDSTLYTGPNFSLGATAQGNLFAQDPKFFNIYNPAGEDLIYYTEDDGLRLSMNSPAINAGTLTDAPESDILGTPRDIIPDIGAYEHGVFLGIQPNTGSTPTATLNAYPNPATDAITFTFTTPITNISTLLLYAIDGQNITTLYKGTTQAGETNTLTINTKSYTPGTYCAVLRCGNGLAQHRTIIIK